jgi:hypothetical protein
LGRGEFRWAVSRAKETRRAAATAGAGTLSSPQTPSTRLADARSG